VLPTDDVSLRLVKGIEFRPSVQSEGTLMATTNPGTIDPTASAGARIIPGDDVPDGPGPEVMAAETLTGETVITPSGEELGKIEAIMLDVRAGRIAYAVLSFGGFLGMGDKLFAIPWSALTLDTRMKNFILDASREKLERAPGFDKDHWPSMADSRWATELHGYYDVVPYWRKTVRSSGLRI
jgi:sporulation protein YlmC with PRC-barrel domain